MHLLGEVALTVDGEPIDLGTPKERHLFGVLALHAGTLVSRDRVVDALWPERPPAKPAASLRPYVSHLRDALGGAGLDREVLATEAEGYALRIERALLDVERFEALVARAHEEDRRLDTRTGLLEDALALVRGEPFADMPYAEFAQAEIHRLTELITSAHELRAELAVESGDAARWAPHIAGLAERYPNRDRLCAALMRALVDTGRRGEALRVFSAHRERLIDEIGLDPGPELRALELDILAMDDEPDDAFDDGVDDSEPPQRRLATVMVVGESMVDDVRAVIAGHGGTLDPDDPQVAWFGLALTREGDADRAVRAALQVGGGRSPGVGIATGWLTPGSAGDDLVDGAAALASTAGPGAVLVDETTSRLAGRWIGFEETTGAGLRAVGVGRGDAAPPLIGREEELLLLRRRLLRTTEGEGHVAAITGEAGIGKSRLIGALVDDVPDLRVVRLACQPFHAGRALHPVADAINRGRADLSLDDAPPALAAARRLLTNWAVDGDEALVSVSDDAEERRHALLRAVVAHVIADDDPVVCVVEDLQWADPSTLELVEALVDATGAHPLALVLSGRGAEDIAVADTSSSTVLPLGGLARSDLVAIVETNAPVPLPAELAESVAARAAGNPLFAEEMARSLDLDALNAEGVPASIHDSLLTRLDRLPECKAVAEAAAVIGAEVDVDLIAAMLDRPAAGVEDDLGRLCANGVMVRRGTGVRQRFRFRHALVRDAVHTSLPPERRRLLHLAAARASLRSRVDEVEPSRLARHWTEAGEALAAARAWLGAAELAIAASSPVEAIGHAERGLDLVGPDPAGEMASVASDLQRAVAAARDVA